MIGPYFCLFVGNVPVLYSSTACATWVLHFNRKTSPESRVQHEKKLGSLSPSYHSFDSLTLWRTCLRNRRNLLPTCFVCAVVLTESHLHIHTINWKWIIALLITTTIILITTGTLRSAKRNPAMQLVAGEAKNLKSLPIWLIYFPFLSASVRSWTRPPLWGWRSPFSKRDPC